MEYSIVHVLGGEDVVPFHVAPVYGQDRPIFYSEGVEAPAWGYPDALSGSDIGLLRDPEGFRRWAAGFLPDMLWCGIKRPSSPGEKWQVRYQTGFEYYEVAPGVKWKGSRYLDIDVSGPPCGPPEWFSPHHQDVIRDAMEAYGLPQLGGVWDRVTGEDPLFRDLLLAFLSEYAGNHGLTVERPL